MTRGSALLAIALLVPRQLPAQTFAFDPTRLHLGIDSMSIAIVRAGQVATVGQLWDGFTLDSSGSTPRVRRIYRTVNQVFGPHLDTTFVLLPGLQPSQRRTRAHLFEDSLLAHDGHLAGWHREGTKPVHAIDRTLDAGVIDASFFDAAVRAAPLAPGYRLTLRGYTPTQDSVITLSAEVTGEDQVTQRDGETIPVWVVRMDFGGLPSTMWIAQSSRAMVRQTIDLTPQVQMLMRR